MDETEVTQSEEHAELAPGSEVSCSSTKCFGVFQASVLVHSHHPYQPCFQVQQEAIFSKKSHTCPVPNGRRTTLASAGENSAAWVRHHPRECVGAKTELQAGWKMETILTKCSECNEGWRQHLMRKHDVNHRKRGHYTLHVVCRAQGEADALSHKIGFHFSCG